MQGGYQGGQGRAPQGGTYDQPRGQSGPIVVQSGQYDKGGAAAPVSAAAAPVSSQGGAQIIRRRIEERNARLEAELFGDAHQSQGISFEKYEDIPVEVSGNDAPLPITSFLDTALPDIIKSNVQLSGYTNPTPVQKYAIPIGLAGRDIMACAQTGSGKTAAFLFPCITVLLGTEPRRMAGYRAKSTPSALVLAPTRELATQIYNEARKVAVTSSWK